MKVFRVGIVGLGSVSDSHMDAYQTLTDIELVAGAEPRADRLAQVVAERGIHGYLSYEGTPIAEVLSQIERYYNLSFNLDDQVSLQGVSCSGKIILTDNLDNVLTALTLISDTRYHRENKSIYIYE